MICSTSKFIKLYIPLSVVLYYGFSIYIDNIFYNVSKLPLFINYNSNFNLGYYYNITWFTILLFIILLLFLLKPVDCKSITSTSSSYIIIYITTILCLLSVLILNIKSSSRADLLKYLNADYKYIAISLTITLWLLCFIILQSKKNIHVYVSSLLVITISIIMVDRSYIFMLIVSLFMRLKTFNIYKFIFYSLIILIIFSTWKVFLFHFIFGNKFTLSIFANNFGFAKIEAIASQSTFINSLNYNLFRISFTLDYVLSLIDGVTPSIILNLNTLTTQDHYIMKLFPEIHNRGGGIGFSLVAEFILLFGFYGVFIFLGYLFILLKFICSTRNVFITYILFIYLFRFCRLDLASGIKGALVFGFLSYVIFLFLNKFTRYKYVVS